MTNDYKNILIIKPSALGDIVHAMPVLPMLRRVLPNARITWLVRKEFAPLLECTDGVDEILLFDRKLLGGWFYRPKAFAALRDFSRRLKQGRFDLVLDLQGLLRTALFARMTGCTTRLGMANAREFATLLYTHAVAPPKQSMHVLDAYFAMLKHLGIQEMLTDCPIEAPASAMDRIVETLKQSSVKDAPYLVLIPSSAHASKCWPAKRFAQVAEQMHQRFGLRAIAVGTAKDKQIIAEIQQHSQVPIADLCGQTSITDLIALLKKASVVISNDTGPGHIADALNTPTVIIFGHTNPQRVGSYQHPERVAAIDPNDRPATIESSNPAHLIKHVSVDMVMEKLVAQLESNKNRAAE